MAAVDYYYPLEWNPFGGGTFDPIAILNDPTATVITNTTGRYTVTKTVLVPGLGSVPVQVSLLPVTSFSPTTGKPNGVVRSIQVDAVVPGGTQALVDVTNIGGLGLQASGIVNGALLLGLADIFTGSDGADLFSSGAGIDDLDGGRGNDTLFAGEGNDLVYGGAGDDVLAGDGFGVTATDGADWIDGGAGADSLYGNGGADTFFIVGNTATHESQFGYDTTTARFLGDVIYDFQPGVDKLDLVEAPGKVIVAVSGASSFVYTDEDGDGLAETGEGQVTVFNAVVQGTDLVLGGGRSVTFYGAGGADAFTGTAQADVLAGFGGADVLTGGLGGDSLYGGADGVADRFRYTQAADSPYLTNDPSGSKADKVLGFEAGVDKLDFSAITGAKTAVVQGFGGSSYVYVDLGGDGSYDMTVILVGTPNATFGDLIL